MHAMQVMDQLAICIQNTRREKYFHFINKRHHHQNEFEMVFCAGKMNYIVNYTTYQLFAMSHLIWNTGPELSNLSIYLIGYSLPHSFLIQIKQPLKYYFLPSKIYSLPIIITFAWQQRNLNRVIKFVYKLAADIIYKEL